MCITTTRPVPFAGKWREVLNSDSAHYGGSNVGNVGEVQTLDGLVHELNLTVPPLAAFFSYRKANACDYPPEPPHASVQAGRPGYNFALFSANAQKVELCLFDSQGRRELERIELPERSEDVWHAT